MDIAARMIILFGIILVVAGLAWEVGGKYLLLGRLPGDIVTEKGSFRAYSTFTVSIALSVPLIPYSGCSDM